MLESLHHGDGGEGPLTTPVSSAPPPPTTEMTASAFSAVEPFEDPLTLVLVCEVAP